MKLENTAAATDIIHRLWDEKLPVDPIRIAEAMGIKVKPFDHYAIAIADFNNAPAHPDEGLSGKITTEEGKTVIYYNAQESELRQRFTIAHELGHHVHAHGDSFRDPSTNFSLKVFSPKEVQANKFAAELLMPKVAVDHLIAKVGIHSLSKLAATFKVSEPAMKYRLKNLNWI